MFCNVLNAVGYEYSCAYVMKPTFINIFTSQVYDITQQNSTCHMVSLTFISAVLVIWTLACAFYVF